MHIEHDVIIIGSGIAGLRAAVALSGKADVAVASKVFPTRSHSGAAQGGITAALGNEDEDRWEWHMFDTVKGSDFLGDQDAIEIMVRDAPRAIVELEHMGVPFNRTAQGKIAQRAFGGHTRDYGKAPVKRACYASDRTGRVILDTLFEQCVKARVRFYAEFYLVDILMDDSQCFGVSLLEWATGELYTVRARAVLLATGGFGKIYKTSSNCYANTGESLSIAFRKGLPLQDMEFVQFHPTGLRGMGILISEAARGEGGVLCNDRGERFMERYAPTIRDLAPRDIVSRSIMREVLAGRGIGGKDYVHLDLTAIGKETIEERLWEIASFAKIYAGINPVTEPIPVQPTCHYMMGGMATDQDGRVLGADGRIPVRGLFAAGECACVSVHGANRLGCNSLLDLVVFGRRASSAILAWLTQEGGRERRPDHLQDPASSVEKLRAARGRERPARIRSELQQSMMDYCSVFRDQKGLEHLQGEIRDLKERYRSMGLSVRDRHFNSELLEAMECEHLLTLAEVMVASALFRRESRGAHYRDDYPERDDAQFLCHTLALGDGQSIRIAARPVNITRFQPTARAY